MPPDDVDLVPRAELERLQRRLERERTARLEAEAIAEKGIAELWSRQRELELINKIAKTANYAKTSRHALLRALQEVCEFTQWPVGHVYRARDFKTGPVLVPTRLWCGADTAGMAAFRNVSQTMRFAPGEGLPGRVLASAKPAWISALRSDLGFPRRGIAERAGLRSGLAFPVLVGADVAAVLEFFTPETCEPDERLLSLMAKIGDQLGRAIERERAETQVRTKNRELRKALRAVDEQRLAAEAANRAKTTFLAVTSHEVRTPLNAVLGLAEGLRREQLTAHQASLVEGILDSGSMLLRLLNAVLELSRIEAGEVSLTLTDFDLAELLAAIIRLWRGRAAELGVDLLIDASNLPSPSVVRGDKGKIEQILTNLVSNALKFSPRGGSVRLNAQAEATGERLSLDIWVEDDGPGIPLSDQGRIFEPYAQTEAGRLAGGAGLGLAICASHVGLMGGSIAAETADGGGARLRLRIELPVAKDPVAPVEAERDADIGGLRVLVAEDNEPNRRVLQVLLAPAGVQLTFAEDGAQACAAAMQQPFDLILMDANMPRMSGVDAVRAIRRLPGAVAQTPIHMLTANAFESDVRAYLAAGADGVLAKPVDVRQLYALLADASVDGGAGARPEGLRVVRAGLAAGGD